MFASKVDGSSGGGNIPSTAPAHVGGGFRADPAPPREHRESLQEPDMRERKLSNSSAANSAAGSKSKWMTAFKGIKGKKDPADDG